MKIRRTEFAMVPTWVVLHDEMRGKGTRIAVYVALRVMSFEMPDYEWRSERELSEVAGRVVGIGHEACRKHIRAMRAAGVITGGKGEIVLLHDPPGDVAGDQGPQLGMDVPEGGDAGPQSPISMRDRENPPPTGEAAGYGAIAREATSGFWERVENETGKTPVGIKFIALAKMIERFLDAGYELHDVKVAVWSVYETGRPMTLAVIEQYLDGRAGAPRRSGGQTQRMDALQAAIAEEERRSGVAE